jgi:phage gpG-like protein
MAGIEVKFTDNSEDFMKEFIALKEKALKTIGLLAEGYAKRMCTVDTGRLRNSITHATSSYSGAGTYSDNKGNNFNDASAKEEPSEDMVVIGTNVEYGPYVELGTVRTAAKPFLKHAGDHISQYKKVIEDVFSSI